MKTQLSDIGKHNAIDKLFQDSGYTNKENCISHNIMLEGVDFDLTYNPLKHLGYKAVLSVVGDIYANLSEPVSLSVGFGLSSKFFYEDVKELWDGCVAAAKEHSIQNISLNLYPSLNGLAISLCALGDQNREIIEKQQSSKNFDLVCLSGDLGAAYMGLHVLEREKIVFSKSQDDNRQPDLSKYKYILESYLSPHIKQNVVSRFLDSNIYPSKGYFLKKGLGDAIKQLSHDTNLGVKIYIDRIPISSQVFSMSEELNLDAVTAAINGGDDYKFIFTIPIELNETFRKEFQDYDVIGHLAKKEVGTTLVTPDGAEIELRAQGW